MRVSSLSYTPGVNFNSASSKHSSSVQVQSFPAENMQQPNLSALQAYYLPKNNSVSFRGAPWRLNLSSLGISSYGSITASEAIKAFEKFKLGNYLDIGEDKISYYTNKAIRDENLSFLDRITDTNEKRKFIQYYMNLTGFPDLGAVSSKIKNELINAIATSSSELNRYSSGGKYDVIQAGYDGLCSVGRRKALPGSDIDKAYVILRGGSDSEAEEIVNRFKGHLWENTDQRILSYNHDDAAFPQVYTEGQLLGLLDEADSVVKMNIIKPRFGDFLGGIGYAIGRRAAMVLGYADALKRYNEDYVAANKFFIELCQKFPKRYCDSIDLENVSRENIKNVGFVLEAMREGERFSRFGSIDASKLEDSLTFRYTNLSQLHSLKASGDHKPKRVSREHLSRDFRNWSIDKQFRFVKTLIEGSCANNTNFTTEFPQYFSKSGNDPFAPLIRALMD